MIRRSRELGWKYCRCCSFDTQSTRSPRRAAVARRVVRRIAKRREQRRWVRESREEME